MSCGQKKIATCDWKTVVIVGLASTDTFLARSKMKLRRTKRQEIGGNLCLFNLIKVMGMYKLLEVNCKNT